MDEIKQLKPIHNTNDEPGEGGGGRGLGYNNLTITVDVKFLFFTYKSELRAVF